MDMVSGTSWTVSDCCVSFQILSHLGQIDAGEASELKSYIQKVLMSEGNTQHVDSEVNGTTDDNKISRVCFSN